MKNLQLSKLLVIIFILLIFLLPSLGNTLFAEEKMIPYIYVNDPENPQDLKNPYYHRAQGDFSNEEDMDRRGRQRQAKRRTNRNRAASKSSTPASSYTARTSSQGSDQSVRMTTVQKVDQKDRQGKDLYTMEYRDADIQDVIEDVSEITKKNFLVDPRVKGTITIISPTPITADEVWEVFLSALTVRSFTTVQTGKIIKIVPLEEAANAPLRTYSGDYTPATDNFITRLYTPKYVSATEMATAIKPLISKRGDVQAYKQTNTVIITDSGLNIRRIIKIFEQLDREGSKEQLEVIPLLYANPQEIADTIRQIYVSESQTQTTTSTRKSRRARRAGQGQEGAKEGPLSISKVLPDVRTNSVIVVASELAMERIKILIQKLDIEIKDPKGNIHVYYLEHARAEDLAQVLANLANSGRSGPSVEGRPSRVITTTRAGQSTRSSSTPSAGPVVAELLEGIQVTADANTNSLVITASQQEFEGIKKVIAQLDIRRRQVFIETVIMELSIDKDRNLGISLTGGIDPGGNPIVAASSFTSLNPLDLSSAALAGLSGLNVAGFSSEDITLTLSDGTTTTVPAFSAVLQALEASVNVNILSTPNILTTDNEEAEIIVGQNIPFVTESGRDSNNNPIIQIEREDVAITLRVTPNINEGDTVRLDVFQEITELIPNQNAEIVLNQGPSTTKRSVKNTVVVKNGQTIVLGGLITDKTTVAEARIPFLGQIPILGFLFKTNRKQNQKANLLIFLTPYIIDSPEDFKRILVKKIEERNNFVKRNYGWIQRKEIKNSLKHHQKALLEISEDIQRKRKLARKGRSIPDKEKPFEKKQDTFPKQRPSTSQSPEYHQQEVDIDKLLDTF